MWDRIDTIPLAVSKSNAELDKTDVLLDIIQKDKNAIDINKRTRVIDPKYALDYKHADITESDEDSFSDGDIDTEFRKKKLDTTKKIDDALGAFEPDRPANSATVVEAKSAAVSSITRDFLLMKRINYDSEDDSDDADYNPLAGELRLLWRQCYCHYHYDCHSDDSGKSNREAVDRAAQEERAKLKEKHQLKKEKDKGDRAKQKELVKARKENEKKRTQKSEKRRWSSGGGDRWVVIDDACRRDLIGLFPMF